MKCKQCGKNVRNISHWAREHKKWLRSRPRRKKTRHQREIEHASKAGPGPARGPQEASHYCPLCGRRH